MGGGGERGEGRGRGGAWSEEGAGGIEGKRILSVPDS